MCIEVCQVARGSHFLVRISAVGLPRRFAAYGSHDLEQPLSDRRVLRIVTVEVHDGPYGTKLKISEKYNLIVQSVRTFIEVCSTRL